MLQTAIRYSISSDVAIYAIRCVLGFLIGYQLYVYFSMFQAYWTLISIILVISPDTKDAKNLALERFKSNLIGSFIGLGCFILYEPNVYAMLLGIVLTIAVCYLFQLMDVARTAVVAFIIIAISEQAHLTWVAAIYRFLSVTIGCLIGLSITVSTALLINYLRNKANLPFEKF